MHKVIKIDPDSLLKEIKDLIDQATERGLIIKMMGATAIYFHVKNSINDSCMKFYSYIGRIRPGEFVLTDVDFVSVKKQRNMLEKFFEKMGYMPDAYINAFFSDKRLTFYDKDNRYTIDIFFTPLEFSHEIDLEGRLELHPYTLSLADLVLLKLQIHDINRKDLGDLATLLACFELSSNDKLDAINLERIVRVLSDDWGFWYDATMNLNSLIKFIEQSFSGVEGDLTKLAGIAVEKARRIIDILEKSPKTDKWMKRAKVGTKKRWYNVVEEI